MPGLTMGKNAYLAKHSVNIIRLMASAGHTESRDGKTFYKDLKTFVLKAKSQRCSGNAINGLNYEPKHEPRPECEGRGVLPGSALVRQKSQMSNNLSYKAHTHRPEFHNNFCCCCKPTAWVMGMSWAAAWAK